MADQITTSESLSARNPQRQTRAEPSTRTSATAEPTAIDSIQIYIDRIFASAMTIPNSEELAAFLAHMTQAKLALDTLRMAEADRAREHAEQEAQEQAS